MEAATAALEPSARSGRSTAESITWAKPIAVHTAADARCIVRPRTPCVDVVPEAMVIASSKINGCLVRQERRVEAPPNRTIEDSARRDERVGTEPRVPVPAGTDLTVTIPAAPACREVA